ncbi:MAG TPA: NfeD family protein [Casimicrobiaceae bacterium]|nr:NfeD family protein [Casimicrobiaceae bacterium]
MAAQWMWWILGVVLVGAELVTGTFYLLALGIAFVVGGVAAWLGASTPVQLLVAGILALAGSFVAHRWRLRRGTPLPQPSLDVGQQVHVHVWHPDGTARVVYRGTQWDAEVADPAASRDRMMVIVATRGSTLVIAPVRPAA